MTNRLGWNDDWWTPIEEDLFERIQRATVFAWQKIQEELNVPRDKRRRRRKRDTSAGRRGSTYIEYIYPPEGNPQRGGPPGKQTGFGAGNVVYQFDREKLKGRIGVTTNALYMLFLELGHYPWLFSTIKKYWNQIAAMAGFSPKQG